MNQLNVTRKIRLLTGAGRISILPLFFLSSSALAQAASSPPPGVSNTSLLQTFFGLIFVVALLFVLTYFLRRFSNLKALGAKGPLKMAGGLMIGPRERILLIEIENTWLVVGIVPGQIKTLYTLPKGELPETPRGEMAFGKWLKQISERNHESK